MVRRCTLWEPSIPGRTRKRRKGVAFAGWLLSARAGSAVGLLLCAVPSLAQAQDRQVQFDVPAQDLAVALQQFARQAGVHLLFPYRVAAGKRSRALNGRLSARQALERLIRDQGLRVVRFSPERITLGEAPARHVVRPSPPPRPASRPPVREPKAEPAAHLPPEEIIVTGRAVTSPFDQTGASYAVSIIDADTLARRGPVSTAELFRLVPGFWVESSGGEAGNNVRSRGIPTDGFTSIALAENGVPVQYDGGLGYLNTDQSFRIDETIERVEVVRGGPSSLFTPNAPGGVANVMTRSGLREQGGRVTLSLGDNGYRRIDGYAATRIADDWGLMVGGFHRRDGGRRRPGYVADAGGQYRAALDFDDGRNKVSVDLRHLDDRVTFYLPVPLRFDPAGGVHAIPGFDPLRDSLAGPGTRQLSILTNEGPFEFDLTRGTSNRLTALTLRTDLQLKDDLRLASALRWRTSDTLRNGLFPTGVPMRGDAYLASVRAATLEAFPQASDLTLNYATDGAQVPENANGNGLVVGANLLSVHIPFDEWFLDNRLSWAFEGHGRHNLALGVTLARYSYAFDRTMGTVLLDLADEARLVDVIARDAAGKEVGRYTDRGFQRYGSIFDRVDMTAQALAFYAADEWQITPRLRLDFGARWERSRLLGDAMGKTMVDLGDPATLADDQVLAPSGETIAIAHSYHALSWSFGASYRLAKDTGVFARYTSSFRLPSASEFNTNPARTDQAAVPIRMVELGANHASPGVSLFVTGFYTRYERLPFTDFRFDTISNSYQERTAIAGTETWGVELEARLRLHGPFDLSLQAAWQRPLYREFAFTALVDGLPTPRDYSGHQLVRVPRLSIRAVPAVELFDGGLRAELSVAHYSRRYSDIANSQRLPAYTLLGLDVRAKLGGSLTLSLHLANLTNTIGLTEGNPRVGSFETGTGTDGNFFARPEFGRSVRAGLTAQF